MKVVAIDIETTGLDPARCQVLSVGMAITDPNEWMYAWPFKEWFRYPHQICGDLVAIEMNMSLLKWMEVKYAECEGDEERLKKHSIYLTDYDLVAAIRDWLDTFQGIREKDRGSIYFTGKNAASFNLQFMNRLAGFKDEIKPKHRVLDIGSMYKPYFPGIPDLSQVLAFIGLPSKVEHTAKADCYAVCEAIRRFPPLIEDILKRHAGLVKPEEFDRLVLTMASGEKLQYIKGSFYDKDMKPVVETPANIIDVAWLPDGQTLKQYLAPPVIKTEPIKQEQPAVQQ